MWIVSLCASEMFKHGTVVDIFSDYTGFYGIQVSVCVCVVSDKFYFEQSDFKFLLHVAKGNRYNYRPLCSGRFFHR